MSKAGLFGTALFAAALTCGCTGPAGGPEADAAVNAAAVSAAPAVVAPAGAAGTSAGSTGAPAELGNARYGIGPEVVTVTSVTDGDTFRVGDRRIRVIGIDSCEAATVGGQQATAAARRVLSGATVTLTREPGVDLDRYGREVRYVGTSAGDLGRLMVPGDHTGVYRGGNNAAASYLAGLTALDAGGRGCGASTTSEPAPATRQKAPQAAPRTEEPRTTAPRTTAPRQAVQAPPASSGGAYYKNCSAARAAGAAPLYRGQPGYAAKLDRDDDGVACEG